MRIERHTLLEHPAADVIAWHERPGALVRLTPPGLASLEDPTAGGLEVGRRVALRLGPPVLPAAARPRWELRHADLVRQGSARQGAADPGAADPGGPRLAFTDRQVSGPFRAWQQEHVIAPRAGGGSSVHDVIHAELPAGDRLGEGAVRAQIERTLDFRAAQLREDLAFWAARSAAPRLTVAIAGASGLIGTQLAALLETGGHTVRRMVRGRDAREGEISWDPARGRLDPGDLEGVDAVVNLAGRSIATRLTPRARSEILSSRTSSADLIARTLAGMREGPRTLIQASAIGYYGARRPGELLTEQSAPGDDVLAGVCVAWEACLERAERAGVRTAALRTGIVLSDAGGALLPQLPLFLLGTGGRLTRKDAVTSWITLDDMVRAYAHALLEPAVQGPVNAVAPGPVTSREFARTLGRVLHRPALVPVPAVGPELILGREGARELVQADQRVSDERLRGSGFAPAHRELEPALRHVLRR